MAPAPDADGEVAGSRALDPRTRRASAFNSTLSRERPFHDPGPLGHGGDPLVIPGLGLEGGLLQGG